VVRIRVGVRVHLGLGLRLGLLELFFGLNVRSCQHNDGYTDSRSHIAPHRPTDTGSQSSVLPDGHPSKY